MQPLPIALATWLALITTSAGAADRCLSGSSTLPDQRQLAALRDATDSACPCTAFTGTPGAGRGAYQRCARVVLRDTLAAAGLRHECKRSAIAVNKGAVCGSGKVACGRFDPPARMPVSCRVTAAGQCEDGRGVDATACTEATHCADVVDWTAGTCVDVRENGRFAPGVQVITFTKESAATYCAGGMGNCTTKPYGPGCGCGTDTDCESNSCMTQPRTLNTVIWYPAPPGSSPIGRTYGAVVDAPLDPSGGPYPILMFSHGSCGYPGQSLFLTPLLATYGFIVVAPPHPGNTIFEFPNCGTSPAQLSSLVERPQDILYVLDQVLAAGDDPASPFFGAIDASRIGMSGHSFGGLTTYLAVARDARFKVALPLAPAIPGSPVLTVPSLTMLGQIDAVVNDDAIRAAYADALPPKYLVEIANTGHFAFSDACFPSPDCAPPVTLTQAEAHDVVRRYALPFLEVYLAGDASFVPFLALPPGPGVVLQAEL